MKTCNFGGAHPRLFDKNANEIKGNVATAAAAAAAATEKEEEGILCQAEPIARYGMIHCRQRNCILCQAERQSVRKRPREEETEEGYISEELFKVGVKFSSNQVHRFVNKYEAILNCHAVSATAAAATAAY